MGQVGEESDQYDFSGRTECNHSSRHVSWMSIESKKAWAIVGEFGSNFRNTWQKTVLKPVKKEKLRDKCL
jgi:hypothetical protein